MNGLSRTVEHDRLVTTDQKVGGSTPSERAEKVQATVHVELTAR
jgi:hypothetical protein